jgi:hypothetical protein
MAPKKDALDASGATTEQPAMAARSDAAADKALALASLNEPTVAAAAPAAVVEPVDPTQEYLDPREELNAAAAKLRKKTVFRSLRDTIDIFTYVRNHRWGVSSLNGIAVDLDLAHAQWDKQKHILPAHWAEVAKNQKGYKLDVRGANNQLWFTRPPVMDEAGVIVKQFAPLPVRGYSDTELPPPMSSAKHWLEKIRPDLMARRARIQERGMGIPLPDMPNGAADMPEVIAAFEQGLAMAENVLASAAAKK